MTDNDIIKALKKLLKLMLSDGDLQRASTISKTIDFINRQNAEIERLNKENADREISHINLYNEMKDRLRDAKEETNMYKQFWLDSYNEGEMYEAKNEAVKEFAEMVKETAVTNITVGGSTYYCVGLNHLDDLIEEFTEGE